MKLFRCQEIAQLRHELSMSPARHRLRQVTGISRAISLINPKREYPYAFVCFHVTGYRPRTSEEILLSGKALIADLVTLIDDLTAAHPLPLAAARGRLEDAESLARRFSVSTKTISRWRKRGLVAAWYVEGGKERLSFSGKAIRTFVADNMELVRRGASFRLMRQDEKDIIVTRARELVAAGEGSLHSVTLKLAEETGRAVETIRYTLRKFDQEHAADALFDKVENARPVDESDVIYEAFMRGETILDLSRRFGKTQKEISRLVTRVRTRELADSPIAYIYNEAFEAPGAETTINAPIEPQVGDDSDVEVTLSAVPSDLPPYLRELYHTPLLTAEGERHLFRRMNYRLHKAELLRLRVASDPEAATASDVAAVDAELEMALLDKNRLTQSNLRLVVSIARRHLGSRAGANLFELVSDGNIALMKAVEKFDYARGFRFSTYASWAIMRTYARSVPEEYVHNDRFRTGYDEVLASTRDYRSTSLPLESQSERIHQILAGGLAELEERERLIVQSHFGLCDDESSRTLDQIGRELGISKERVRQIEARALGKLRNSLGDDTAELLVG